MKEELAELEAAARERIKRASGNSVAVMGSEVVARKVKVLVLGDSGVGKSSLINRWISDTFNPSLVTTLGVDLKTRRLHIDDKIVQVQVWDTAGQTAFHRITTSYYRGSNAILLVFDVSDRATLQNVEYWMKNIKEQAAENVQVALIGNKIDLRETLGQENCVRSEEGKATGDKYKVVYAETSAMRSGEAVEQAFEKLVRKVISMDKKGSGDGSRSPESTSLFLKRDNKGGDKVMSKIAEDEIGSSSQTSSNDNTEINEDSKGDKKKKDCTIS